MRGCPREGHHQAARLCSAQQGERDSKEREGLREQSRFATGWRECTAHCPGVCGAEGNLVDYSNDQGRVDDAIYAKDENENEDQEPTASRGRGLYNVPSDGDDVDPVWHGILGWQEGESHQGGQPFPA